MKKPFVKTVLEPLGVPRLRARRAAREKFYLQHPNDRIAWSRIAANEPDRYVVGVFYGYTRPPGYRFYAIEKKTNNAVELEDGSSYGEGLRRAKRKSTLGCIGVLLAACLVCITGLWLKNRAKTPMELLWPLTATQRQCVEQVTDRRNLIYVEKQADEDSVVIGYTVGEDYCVSMLSVDQNGSCNIEFRHRAWNCYDEWQGQYCREGDYTVRLRKVREIELTGSQPPELYVWLDVLGIDRRSGAKHTFYIEQADGSYEAVLTRRLCVGRSTVQILEESYPPIIAFQNDWHCDEFPSNRQSYVEYSLATGEPQVIKYWRTGGWK